MSLKNNKNALTQLIKILGNRSASEHSVLFRGQEELSSLNKWLKSLPEQDNALNDENLSISEIIKKCDKCSGELTKKMPIG